MEPGCKLLGFRHLFFKVQKTQCPPLDCKRFGVCASVLLCMCVCVRSCMCMRMCI
jgi:hypothetical protein